MNVSYAPAGVSFQSDPKTAVQTGLNMLKAVEKFNEQLIEKGRPKVGMGAGINTGLGYIGEMGSTARHSYDVLGDAVSTTARLEGQCKAYGVLLIIGPSTYEATKNDFFYLKLDDLAVKGKSVGLEMSSFTDHTENLVLTWLLTSGTATRPTAWYVACSCAGVFGKISANSCVVISS